MYNFGTWQLLNGKHCVLPLILTRTGYVFGKESVTGHALEPAVGLAMQQAGINSCAVWDISAGLDREPGHVPATRLCGVITGDMWLTDEAAIMSVIPHLSQAQLVDWYARVATYKGLAGRRHMLANFDEQKVRDALLADMPYITRGW